MAAVWGTNLRFENSDNVLTISEIWWGVGGVSDYRTLSPPDPPAGLIIEFLDSIGNNYSTWVKAAAAEPASFTWSVQFRKVKNSDPRGGKVSSTMENIDTRFVPQDYSVVLENTDLGIKINLRTGTDNVTGTNIRTSPILAALNVDNAVNIRSIENLDPLIGKPGDNLRLRVTVKNTGRYIDNYAVSAGGSIDPTILNLAPDSTDNVIVTTALPSGTQNIVITAAGNYATDKDYVTASGLLVRKVEIGITPSVNFGENGDNLTFDVLVKNVGDFPDNYSLTIENVWVASLSSTQLDNLNPGENVHATLSIKIPDNANPGDSDNITLTATSTENAEVSDSATCIARMGSYSVEVSIAPSYQDNGPGGTLNYIVTVSNTGTLNDSYTLAFADNIDGNSYWEDNISLENSSLTIAAGQYRTTNLTVTIPENALPGTNDNIEVTATSQADNLVSASDGCIANVSRLSITISPVYQSGLPGVKLTYMVHIINNEDADAEYHSVVTDNLGWKLAFGIKDITFFPFGEIWVTLKVTIPENAIGGTDDNVTVTMVSNDNTISYSATCVANVTVVRGVSVSITPGENSGAPGATLGYVVTVNNTGNVEDNYGLTAIDDAGWSLGFLPASLVVQARSSENAVLNVTIPENAAPLILDNITVTTTSQENENVFGENSCTALSLAVSGLRLLKGWNLVGFPFTSGSTTPRNLFPGLNYLTDFIIYSWNAPTGPYLLQGLDTPMIDNIGYWIYVNQDNTIITSGIPLENRTIDLIHGWNLVHFPVVDNNTTPAHILPGLTYLVDFIIYSWNAPTGPYLLQGYNQPFLDNLGYWFFVQQDNTVTVP